MSVITSIRDYIEILNTQVGSHLGADLSIFSTIYDTTPHFFQLCKENLWYFFSFKGLRDNFYQPYLNGLDQFGVNPLNDLQLQQNLATSNIGLGSFFFTGVGNSFFISVPGSVGTLLIIRRLITQGTYAGIFATIGGVLGNCFVVACVIFGSRVFVLSPAFLDISFYLGLLIPVTIILRGLIFSDFRIIPARDRLSLIFIGLMHFLLGISNESTLFRHFRDLTIGAYPTRFFGISSYSSGLIYILGFSIGSFFFAFSAFYGVLFFINWWLARSTITRSRLMKWSENTSIVLLTCLSISTCSYYGADFLLTKSFGFLPGDKAFYETVLAPNSIFKDPHNLTGVHALYPSNEFSLDPAPFDRPLDKLFRRSILLKQQGFKYRSFEELNYQGEKHWLHRGFRHGSAKPIKNVSLSEKNKLSEGRALLRSLDKAIGWDSEEDQNKKLGSIPKLAFTNLALEEIPFNFSKLNLRYAKHAGSNREESGNNNFNDELLEQKFKRFFFGQIGLLPGRLPPVNYGPFDSQEMAHKRLAFTNPVYKALLSFDIDLFLQRQPPRHILSAEDEHNLYLKRQLLERYINTQRDYFQKLDNFTTVNSSSSKNYNKIDQSEFSDISKLFVSKNSIEPISESKKSNPIYSTNNNQTLLTLFDKDVTNQSLQSNLDIWAPLYRHKEQFFTKSFANQTYKHQFKGTLEIVRQMFAVSLDCPEPSSVAGGGAWDKNVKVNGDVSNFFKDDKGLVIPRPINPRILKFDQPLYTPTKENTRESVIIKQFDKDSMFRYPEIFNMSDSLVFLSHEELYKYFGKRNPVLSEKPVIQQPFLESASMSPFYVGWDNERRQLLLTQRYLSRKEALIFSPQTLEFKTGSSASPQASDTQKNVVEVQNNQHLSDKTTSPWLYDKPDSKIIPENSAISFATWPVLKADPNDKITKWRIPSRPFEHMVALEEEARLGLEEPSDKNKGLRGSYENFVDFWNKTREGKLSSRLASHTSFNVSRWPSNITTPSVQADLDNFDQIEDSLFTGVKRGGFIWPGSNITGELKMKKN